MKKPVNPFYPDGVVDPFGQPRVEIGKVKTLDPSRDPEDVFHDVGQVLLVCSGAYEAYGVDRAFVVLRKVTRAMVIEISPPPVDNPHYVYLWVNDEIANVIDRAIELGWCKEVEFSTSDSERNTGGPWDFAVTAALFK